MTTVHPAGRQAVVARRLAVAGLVIGAFASGPPAMGTQIPLDAAAPSADTVSPGTTWIATVTRSVAARVAPVRIAPVRAVLQPVTPYSLRRAGYLATAAAEDGDGRIWVRVQLPLRPNQSTAWIPASAVNLTRTSVRVVVRLAARRVEVWRGSRRIAVDRAGIGRPDTPTPTGVFAVEDIVPTATAADRAMYGRYVVTLTAHSTVLRRFNGGDGQVAIHGSSSARRIGAPSSHGCVILGDASLRRLVRLVRPGTPVIVARR